MRWPEPVASAALALAAALPLPASGATDEPPRRFVATIVVERAAPLVRLPLPAAAYAHSRQPGLADLRIVDADGERVPFALLPPRPPELGSNETRRAATLYPLPARPLPGGDWLSPLELSVQGDRISVKRRGGPVAPGSASGGWLVDTGERRPQDPPTFALHLSWAGPAEFSAGYALHTSADLRQWRPAGGGQLLALAGAGGPLTQPLVGLPEAAPRFVRLVWADPARAPQVTAAQALSQTPRSTPLDPPIEWTLAPLPAAADAAADPEARRTLDFDLGGVMPVAEIDLQGGAGNRVVPLRVLGRDRSEAAWRGLGAAVFYRFERDGAVSASAPLVLGAEVRHLRLVADPRSPPFDAATTRLVVRAGLSQIVFAQQGRPPYRLQTGAAQATPASALALATLVPRLDEERERFGLASLAGFTEDAAAARQADSALLLAALRPWLLWAVLLAGVAGLAFMVWRLTRTTPPAA